MRLVLDRLAPAAQDTGPVFGDAGLDAGLVGLRTDAAARAIPPAAGLTTFCARGDARRFALTLLLDAGSQAAGT